MSMLGPFALALALVTPDPGPKTFLIDSIHSSIGFAVPFLGLNRVRGGFDSFAGALSWDAEDPLRSSVTLAIDVQSLHTGNERRDGHLRSADFLDVERYPRILFASESVRREREGYVLGGGLTLRGTTRPVEIAFRPVHDGVAEQGGVRYLDFEGQVSLRWRDFGIAGTGEHNPWFQPQVMTIGDLLDVTLVVQAARRSPETMLKAGRYARLERLLSDLEAAGFDAWAARYRAAVNLNADASDLLLVDAATALRERGFAAIGLRLARLHFEPHPASAEAASALALALWEANERAEAARFIREALTLDPTEPLASELDRRMRRTVQPMDHRARAPAP